MPTPLIYTANRNKPLNQVVRASWLQLSAHESQGRVPGLAYAVRGARARACAQAQTCSHSFRASSSQASLQRASEMEKPRPAKAQQIQLLLLTTGHREGPAHSGNGSIFSLNVSQNFILVLLTVKEATYTKQSKALGTSMH